MFGLVIGKCYIVPPSAKAALAIVAWFFGALPGMPWSDYEALVQRQYQAVGYSVASARAAVANLEACFSTWKASSP